MNYLVWQRDAAVAIASRRRIVPAAEVPLLRDAQALCERLAALEDARPAQLAVERERARTEGWTLGREEGLAAAKDEAAAHLAALSAAFERAREQVVADVALLALAAVRKLMGTITEGDRLAALARAAALEVVQGSASAPSLRLVVADAEAEAVRARLRVLEAQGGPPAIEVHGDTDRPPGTCLLESLLGSVDASLEVQLARLADAWQVDDPAATAPAAER